MAGRGGAPEAGGRSPAAPEWGATREMNAIEEAMWRSERHPSYSATGTIVELLETTPDWDAVREVHERATTSIARLRERVTAPAVPVGPPVWSVDANFSLDEHVRRITLAGPGTVEELLRFVQSEALTPFDRTRALWRATLVEGLDGGRAAYVFRAHHCLTDGMGAMQLLGRLHAESVGDVDLARAVMATGGGRTPGPAALAARHLVSHALRSPQVGRTVVGAAARVVSRGPEASFRYAKSLVRVLTPPRASSSALLEGGSRYSWRFGVIECPLPELKAAAGAAGGTINDAFVAAVLGGLRRYHESIGESLGSVPVTVPVSIRRPGDPQGGNRFTAAFITAPAGTEDPGERIRALGQAVRAAAAEPAMGFTDLVLPLLNLAPDAVVTAAMSSLQSRCDVTASNVRGPAAPRYLAGAEVSRMYCFGPLPGTALCAMLCSYAGTCGMAFNCDGSVFADPELLWRCMEEGLGEVLGLGAQA